MIAFLAFFAAFFAVLPGLVVLVASLTADSALSFPPVSLSFKWYAALLASPDFLDAMVISASVAGATSVLALAISIPAAYGLVRYPVRGAAAIEGFLLSPLAVPHLIIGLGILQVYSYTALRADLVTLTIGHLILTVPFVLRILMAAFQGLDPQLEHAALSLGATRPVVLRRVVLPQIKAPVFGAMIAAFVLSFDDVGLTIFLVQPGYTTVPILLFNQAENNPSPAIHAASVILLLLSWVGVFLVEKVVGVEKMILAGRTR